MLEDCVHVYGLPWFHRCQVKDSRGNAAALGRASRFVPAATSAALVEQAAAVGLKSYPAGNPDILSLKHTVLFGIKGGQRLRGSRLRTGTTAETAGLSALAGTVEGGRQTTELKRRFTIRDPAAALKATGAMRTRVSVQLRCSPAYTAFPCKRDIQRSKRFSPAGLRPNSEPDSRMAWTMLSP